MPLGQAPFDPASTVAACDHRDMRHTVVNADDHPSCRDLLHLRQPVWQLGRSWGGRSHYITVASLGCDLGQARGSTATAERVLAYPTLGSRGRLRYNQCPPS